MTKKYYNRRLITHGTFHNFLIICMNTQLLPESKECGVIPFNVSTQTENLHKVMKLFHKLAKYVLF